MCWCGEVSVGVKWQQWITERKSKAGKEESGKKGRREGEWWLLDNNRKREEKK